MVHDLEIIEEINDGIFFLRKITKQDANFVYHSLNEKDLITFLSLGPLMTLEDSKRLIRRYLKYWENYVQFNYIIELREAEIKKVGSISLWNVNWRHRRAEVGIWIIPVYWSNGYGKRALNLITNVAFNHLKLNRLEAHIATENKSSIHLFKICGFKHEGILRQYLNFNGKLYDSEVLALLRNEFFKEKEVKR
ncbi:MAG: GNAT family N-acetyltransferase [Promethearchaeota archaeon]|jgi:ribosomal-protein-alanine N-acetyltransferase